MSLTLAKPKSQRGRQPSPLLCPDQVRLAANHEEGMAEVLVSGEDFPAEIKVSSAAQRIRQTVERIGLKGAVSIGFGEVYEDEDTGEAAVRSSNPDDANALILSPKSVQTDEAEENDEEETD